MIALSKQKYTPVLSERLIEKIEPHLNFPSPGITFQDALPILRDPNLFRDLINEMSSLPCISNAEAIIAIDARGFIFGSAVAISTGKPLVFARKKGKIPGELIEESYSLEYGNNVLCIQKKAIEGYKDFCIIDDLLATGGTASAVEKMLLSHGKEVFGVVVIIELVKLYGWKRLKSKVYSQISI